MTTRGDQPPPDSPQGRLTRAFRLLAGEEGRGGVTTGVQDALRAIAELRGDLDDREAQIVFALRLAGTPWEAIVAELGTSCEAARERFTAARVLDRLREVRASRPGDDAACPTSSGYRPAGERRSARSKLMGASPAGEAAHGA